MTQLKITYIRQKPNDYLINLELMIQLLAATRLFFVVYATKSPPYLWGA